MPDYPLRAAAAFLLMAASCASNPPPAHHTSSIQASATESPQAGTMGHGPADSPSAPASSGSAATATRLVIAPLRLVTHSGEAIQLTANGSVLGHSRGKTRFMGMLTPAGEFVAPSGELLLALRDDGVVMRGDGVKLPVRLLSDGTAASGTQRLFFNDSNEIETSERDAPPVRSEGVTKTSRPAAMFLLILAAFSTGR